MTKPFTPATGDQELDQQFAKLWAAIKEHSDRDIVIKCIDTSGDLTGFCEELLVDVDDKRIEDELAGNARAIGDHVRSGDADAGFRRGE